MTRPDSIFIFSRKGWHLWPSLFIGTCLAACSLVNGKQESDNGNEAYQQQRQEKYIRQVYPAVKMQVKTGDLVCRLGSDITSEMFRQMNKQDASYSHCGIVSIENDSIFVYHAIGGEFNPDQQIKRETLFSFGQAADNKAMAIYRPASLRAENKIIAAKARQYFLQKIPFDMKFNYQTEDRFYCAEFVAKCMVRGLQDSSWLRFTTVGQLQYVAVDNLFKSPLVSLVNRYSY